MSSICSTYLWHLRCESFSPRQLLITLYWIFWMNKMCNSIFTSCRIFWHSKMIHSFCYWNFGTAIRADNHTEIGEHALSILSTCCSLDNLGLDNLLDQDPYAMREWYLELESLLFQQYLILFDYHCCCWYYYQRERDFLSQRTTFSY